jgi:hypothetical protein
MFFGDFPERSEFVNAGIGEEHVDAAGLRLNDLVNPIDIAKLRRIRLDRGDISPNLGDRLVEFRLTAAGDEDLRAFLDEALRRTETDAGAAACDDRYLACKLSGHFLIPSDTRRSFARRSNVLNDQLGIMERKVWSGWKVQ